MQDKDSVDFLKPEIEIASPTTPPPIAPRRRRFSVRSKLALFGLAILGTGGFLLSTGIASSSPAEPSENLSFMSSLRRLVGAEDRSLDGSDDDRINFLLLGIGGAGHDGSELTDTIMFGSFKPSTDEVGLISIPRDLSVNIPGYGYRKINNVNAFAEMEKRGSGPEATADTVETILGEEINYWVKVDFDGFADIIDDLGGIDVYVDRSFTDPTYPLDDGLGSVESISFTQGMMHMDGATALKFARSRHGSNGEGSDFARAARQQKIIVAAKDKALSLGVLLNPSKLNRIINTVQENVKTNLSIWEMMRFAKDIPDISSGNIAMHVLDNRSGLLYDDMSTGAYLLLPYEEDWSELHAVADNIFKVDGPTNIHASSAPATTPDLNVSVEIQNGTQVTGLASQTAQLLESSGFSVETVGNAADRNTTQTIIYDFTNGEKDDELAALKEYLHAQVYMSTQGFLVAKAVVPDQVFPETPGKNLSTNSADVDFLIVLGQNSSNLVLR